MKTEVLQQNQATPNRYNQSRPKRTQKFRNKPNKFTSLGQVQGLGKTKYFSLWPKAVASDPSPTPLRWSCSKDGSFMWRQGVMRLWFFALIVSTHSTRFLNNAAPTTWGEDGTTKTSSPISFKQPTSSRDDAVTKEQRKQRHDMDPVNNLECYKSVELSCLGRTRWNKH